MQNASEICFKDDEILRNVGLELMFCTPQKTNCEEGITAVELAKRLGVNSDVVRKKLKILFDNGLVRVIGMNPKVWKFDEYNFQRMDTENPCYQLLCNFADVDFSKYYEY